MAQLEPLELELPVEPKPPRRLEVGAVCDGELLVVSFAVLLLLLRPLLVLVDPPLLDDDVACCSQFGVPGGQAVAGGR